MKIIKQVVRASDARAEIEARRGIVRDEQGRIIRSKEWLEQRVKHLESKVEDCQSRIKNAKAEIAQRKAELKEMN